MTRWAIAFDSLCQYSNKSVGGYIDQFWLILNHLEEHACGPLPETTALGHFITGLLPDIRDTVVSQHPRMMEDTLDLTCLCSSIETEPLRLVPGPYASSTPYFNASRPDELRLDVTVALP